MTTTSLYTRRVSRSSSSVHVRKLFKAFLRRDDSFRSWSEIPAGTADRRETGADAVRTRRTGAGAGAGAEADAAADAGDDGRPRHQHGPVRVVRETAVPRSGHREKLCKSREIRRVTMEPHPIRFRLAKQRLIPLAAASNISNTDDCPRAFHRFLLRPDESSGDQLR